MAIYNGEKYLHKAIKSIISQTYNNWELICIDDGSIDSSKQIINSFDDSRIKYYYQENTGSPVHGRNFGIKVCKGDYIAFLDQDDVYLPESIQKRAIYLNNNNDVNFVYSDCKVIDNENNILHNSIIRYTNKKGLSGKCFEQLFLGIFIPIQGVMVRKKLFERIGLFNEKLIGTEDYEMWLRIAYNNKIHFIDEPLAKWREHSNSLSKSKFLMDKNFLKCLESLVDRYPESKKIVDRNKYNKRLYSFSFDIAYYYYKNKNWEKAIKWHLKCFKYKIYVNDILRIIKILINFNCDKFKIINK